MRSLFAIQVRILILFLFLMLRAGLLPATAADSWTPEFLSSEKGANFTPREALRVRLPDDLADAIVKQLALQLDGFEVTELAKCEGKVLRVQSPQPLAKGEHNLRLVENTADGGMIERGSWTFQVAPLVDTAFSSDLTFNGTFQAADQDLEEQKPEDSWVTDGSMRVRTSAGQDSWQVSAAGDFNYNSSPDRLYSGVEDPPDRNVEVGDFLVKGSAGGLSVGLGHHTPGGESMILQGFSRRGVMADYKTPGEWLLATGFVLRSVPVTGFTAGLGIGEKNNRVAGTLLTLKPILKHQEWLALSTVYLDGTQEGGGGYAVVDGEVTAAGKAWGVSAESRLLAERFLLRGEFARTSYDADGASGDAGEETDDALGARVSLAPLRNDWGTSLSLEIGGEYRKVGPGCKSLGNAGLSADREGPKGFLRFSWGGLSLDGSVEREEDNVDNSPLLPTSRREVASANAGLSPNLGPDSPLGRLSLNFSAQQSNDKTIQMPTDYTGDPVDRKATTMKAGLSAAYTAWEWSAGYGTGREEDLTGAQAETSDQLVEISLKITPAGWLQVGAFGQKNRKKNLDSGVTTDQQMYKIEFSVGAFRESLRFHVAGQVDTQKASDDTTDLVTGTVNADLEWKAVAAGSDSPFGLSFWVRGQYQNIDDRLSETGTRTPYQIFAGLTANFSVSSE